MRLVQGLLCIIYLHEPPISTRGWCGEHLPELRLALRHKNLDTMEQQNNQAGVRAPERVEV